MSLHAKQQTALDTLTETGSVRAAANAAGVTRKTLYEWLKEPEFKDALRAIEDDSIRSMSTRLLACSDAAVSVVVRIMADPGVAPSVRLRAADTVLGRVLELRELQLLEERLVSIETALALRGER